MDDPKLLALLEKYIEGTLSEAERSELEKIIVSSLAARHTFWAYLEQHAFIGELGGEAKGRALARLEKPPTRRSAAPRPLGPRNSGTTPFLIAAGLLIGFVVILIASMSGSDPGEEARSLAAFRAKQAERRKAAEARLREIEQERQRLLSRPVAPEGQAEPRKEEERKKALEALAERQRNVDEELRQAIEDKPAVIVQKAPEPPAPPLMTPENPKTVAAPSAVAKISKVEGQVAVAAGQDLVVGQRLETGKGTVEILYADGTRVSFGPGTVARDFKAEGGKRFWMDAGSMHAVVAKQLKGQPMVVESKHGDATVVGTTLRIRIDPEATKGMRLEVEEGVVQLKNRLTGKMVMVESGPLCGRRVRRRAPVPDDSDRRDSADRWPGEDHGW
jgi:ferric-dicitrate binding protein FerR (iron transport regulator)